MPCWLVFGILTDVQLLVNTVSQMRAGIILIFARARVRVLALALALTASALFLVSR